MINVSQPLQFLSRHLLTIVMACAMLAPLANLQAADPFAAALFNDARNTPPLPTPPVVDQAEDTARVQALPGRATLLSPKGKIKTPMPAYRWQKVAGASHYYLVVGDPPNFRIATWYSAKQAKCASTKTCTVTPPVALSNGT